MKRLLALLLILVMLAGCTVQRPEPTTEPTTEPTDSPTEPTSPPGAPLYIANSELEQQTAGAVKAYKAHKHFEAMQPLGDNLLVFLPQSSAADIHVYAGEELYLRFTSALLPANPAIQISDNGISYYNKSSREIVLLDADLNETDRIKLPENAMGTPVVDPQQKYAYFCTENEIRALDLETGIARLLRQVTATEQTVRDVCFDGRVLLCDVTDGNQDSYLAFIDTANGKLLGKDTESRTLETFGDAFLMTDSNGNALYGTWDTEIVEFNPAGTQYRVWSALSLGGAVAVRTGTDRVILDFYTLETGLRTASVTLPGVAEVNSVVADSVRGCVWFLTTDTEGQKLLCRWDYALSPVTEETVYLTPCYTEENPDEDGLTELQNRADKLGSTNGMEIRIWKNAVTAPWENLKADYRVSSFRNTLETMEQVLAAFPEGMIAKLASISATGSTSVSIVRGAGETAQYHFQWNERSTYIALETGENGEAAFCEALYRVMDTYLLNSNSILDEWDSDNPVADRTQIFRYAMSADMAEFFEDEDNWDKLDQLCESIRDAFDLEDYEGVLLWEQYL